MLAFLRDDLLSVADPFAGNTDRPRGRNLTLLAAVDLAARNVRQRFPDQPLVEAGIRVTLWQVYFALGNHDQAEEHIQRSLDLYDGADAPELERLKALESMAWMHHARGRYAEATALIEPVLERRTRLQGADHPEVLNAQRCRLAILSASGRHPEAIALGEDLLERARQLPVEHTEVLLRIMGDVSWNYYRQGEFPRCHALSEEAFHIAQERLGKEHALTIELMGDWAKWLRLRLRLGRFHEAARLQQETYDRARVTLGETHDLTLTSLSELALLADAKGLFGRKMEIQERLAPLARQAVGPDSPSAMFEQMRQAWGRLEQGRPQEEGLEREQRLLSTDAPWLHMAYYELANLHARIGQWPRAAHLYAEFLAHYDPAKSHRPGEQLFYAAGLVTALLAGDDTAVGIIGPLALQHARQTSQPWETRHNLIVSLLLAAIAQHRLGNTGEAAHLLLDARNHLERISRAGDLGRTVWYPYEEWLPVAQLALACREAETLIHGKWLQPILAEQTLARAREHWHPVKTLLDEADRAATEGDWPAALDRLRTAIRHEYFDWSAAMQSREHFAAKAVTLLLLGGEFGGDPGLIEQLIHEHPGTGTLSANAVLLLHPDSLPPGALDSIITATRFAAEEGPAADGGNIRQAGSGWLSDEGSWVLGNAQRDSTATNIQRGTLYRSPDKP